MLTKNQIREELLKKAAKDPAFRKKLMANPKEAVKELYKQHKRFDSRTLEKGIVKLYVEKKDELMIVIPDQLAESGALTDEELSKVAAGSCGTCGY